MSLKESLRKLKENEKLSVKKEVKKELKKIKKNSQKCIICKNQQARYFLKGAIYGYCKNCALENFSDLSYLQKK
ncbi:TPA: hypothetical protein HA235_02390 [Candidatus Woesearchaeota archaeon]|nr:hypothetical protein [Candidatus Woesearchaeota archaeon]HIH31533.1 hypothetical protein [Candidatus Woesearchaeota archaeon]HIH54309.1 hypothetical protein [Candidatus Woesearchaeota archaeon]HIJ02501.1 hypothetical protein [Candidatus Woesearchaeota archaeon]HIJ13453.1 hypothetical protein [Candidatus Woesearchaeota archaeon]